MAFSREAVTIALCQCVALPSCAPPALVSTVVPVAPEEAPEITMASAGTPWHASPALRSELSTPDKRRKDPHGSRRCGSGWRSGAAATAAQRVEALPVVALRRGDQRAPNPWPRASSSSRSTYRDRHRSHVRCAFGGGASMKICLSPALLMQRKLGRLQIAAVPRLKRHECSTVWWERRVLGAFPYCMKFNSKTLQQETQSAESSCRSTLLAVSGEDGSIEILKVPDMAGSRAPAQPKPLPLHASAKGCGNAVFDIEWLAGDASVLSASGDQTVKMWDVETMSKHRPSLVATLRGHSGSVKSVDTHVSQPFLVASGARDGKICLWDLRTRSKRCVRRDGGSSDASGGGGGVVAPAHCIDMAHCDKVPGIPLPARKRQKVSASTSLSHYASGVGVTAVSFVGDLPLLATAGERARTIKLWDLRRFACEHTVLKVAEVEPSGRALNVALRCRSIAGVTSLAVDAFNGRIVSSCTDGLLFLHDLHSPSEEDALVSIFGGHSAQSFFVRCAVSKDGSRIASGSTDGCAYVWRVNEAPGVSGIIEPELALRGHVGEVHAVSLKQTAYSSMLASCADDGAVRVWPLVEQNASFSLALPSTRRHGFWNVGCFNCPAPPPPSVTGADIAVGREIQRRSTRGHTLHDLWKPHVQPVDRDDGDV